MLAHKNVVVLHATQRISVCLSGPLRTARRGPRWRGNLQYNSVSIVVPRQHAFRMARRGGLRTHRVPIELIVPNHVKQVVIVYLVERSAKGIAGGVAGATPALLQLMIHAAGVGVLLAEVVVRLHRAAKRTGALTLRAAACKRLGIEFENKPPVGGLTGFQQRSWRSRRCRFHSHRGGCWFGNSAGRLRRCSRGWNQCTARQQRNRKRRQRSDHARHRPTTGGW